MKKHTQRFRALVSLLMFGGCIFFSQPAAAFSFRVPERLFYDVTWTGIKAGEASLEIANNDGLVITSTAKSAKWVSLFYTVDNRVESRLSGDAFMNGMGQPVRYRISLREGKNRRNKEVIFDHGRRMAYCIDHLRDEKKDCELPSPAFDPLSSFYFLRTLPLEVGKSVFVAVFDNRKVWNVEVQVLGRERVGVPAGEFNTIVVKPLMKSEGIFYRKSELVIWLTDDERRIPVKVKTKARLGSVIAQLSGGTY
ncbi:MAG TPA: DUF3108 domain-containing protein [Thermodesulfovibrionales bacterium]|nr:DUF3108 domain-containing protein [Thermodesulfovibrionales bacterium]